MIESGIPLSVEKNKTTVITLANHKGHRQCSEPIKTRSDHKQLMQRRKARENACERVTIGFGFTCDWMKK